MLNFQIKELLTFLLRLPRMRVYVRVRAKSGAKVLLFFDMCKRFWEKVHKNIFFLKIFYLNNINICEYEK